MNTITEMVGKKVRFAPNFHQQERKKFIGRVVNFWQVKRFRNEDGEVSVSPRFFMKIQVERFNGHFVKAFTIVTDFFLVEKIEK